MVALRDTELPVRTEIELHVHFPAKMHVGVLRLRVGPKVHHINSGIRKHQPDISCVKVLQSQMMRHNKQTNNN
jgi:hypothetical protein